MRGSPRANRLDGRVCPSSYYSAKTIDSEEASPPSQGVRRYGATQRELIRA